MDSKKVFNKKTILFGMPKRYGISELIIQNLQMLGFETIDISFQDEHFKYRNIGEKGLNLFRKVFLNDQEFKQILKFKHQKETIEDRIHQLKNKVDFAFLIRPDLYPIPVIEKIKKNASELIGYQWDGLDVFPEIQKRIPFFDRFFVFDPYDQKYPGVRGITNFFFDPEIFCRKENINQKRVYFIGVYVPERMYFIKNFIRKTKNIGIDVRIDIYCDNISNILLEDQNIQGINYINKKETYRNVCEQNLEFGVLVDFVDPKHKGLSLRVFEALGNNQKLITTNPEIKKYEFYRSENILIYNQETTAEELQNFVSQPYRTIPEKIKYKYSFRNWMMNITDVPDQKTINLPD